MKELPLDWPLDGRIDLDVHDLPHKSSTTEWWYVNAHVETADGRPLSVFAAFFRVAKGRHPVTKEVEYGHSVTWAVSDLSARTYTAFSGVDRSAPEMGLEKLKKGKGSKDGRLNRAMREVLEKGKVPRPDRIFDGECHVSEDRLEIELAADSFRKQDDGSYRVTVFDRESAVGYDLVFRPKKAPVRHGDNGLVRGVHGEDMFYYFIPSCDVDGSVTTRGVEIPVRSGSGWYDHEFGGHHTKTATDKDDVIAWNWISTQLDDGTEISVYALVHSETGEDKGKWAIVIDPQGRRYSYTEFSFTPLDSWRSTRTFNDYPTRWSLVIPEAQIDVVATAAFEDQEFITVISKPAFWEGRCNVEGTSAGRPVGGRAYVERSGFCDIDDLDEFFAKVGHEVRRSVARLYPDEPKYEHVRKLIANDARDHMMDGVDVPQLQRTLIAPVRCITDRNGKGWRSYAALACCDVVLGDSRKYVEWLAMPEFVHVGSLIVDDVQDKSTVRRGGPTSHMLYGEAIAINAGTAAYFMGEQLLRRSLVSNAQKLRLYDLYFEALRGGHAGQAIDIDGMNALMPEVVKSGDGDLLERRVLAVHRLKTGAPAGALARMGAVAGGGSDAQVDGVGNFFEAIGLAFQIIDDVLNLRGFKGNLKQLGEDITHGKVTLPIAKAMSRLPLEERTWLWETVSGKPEDRAKVDLVIAKLEACGAVEGCVEHARRLVESAWAELDPVVEDSLAKLMLRAFGWYVLERHY